MINTELCNTIKKNDIVKEINENNNKTSDDLLKELEKPDEKSDEKNFKEKLLLLVNDELSKKYKNKLSDINKNHLIRLINNKESELFLKSIEEFKVIDNKLNLTNISSLIENLYKNLYNLKIKDTNSAVDILKFLIEYNIHDNTNKDEILNSLDELSTIFVSLLILRKNLKKNKPTLFSCLK